MLPGRANKMATSVTMTARQAHWLTWLKQAQSHEMTQKQTAQRMHVSERWVRKLLQRMKVVGDAVVIHGLRGKPSNRRLPDQFRKELLDLVRANCADHSPKLVWAYLDEKHGIRVGRETLRQWMIQDGLWAPSHCRRKEVTRWGVARERRGEYVHWCSCQADWLGRGVDCGLNLIALVGDATSTMVARFANGDSAEDDLDALQDYLHHWGRPLGFRFSKVTFTRDSPEAALAVDSVKPSAQISRILDRLEIAWSSAEPPYPSASVQHFYSAAWARLSERLRKTGITTGEAANSYLRQVYIPSWNNRLTVTGTQQIPFVSPVHAGIPAAAVPWHAYR